jgi:phenylacetate-CoA ligase
MWPLAAPFTNHFSPPNMFPPKSAAPLEPIERASQDELRALQLTRLKWSLQHAYDRVRHYRERFSALGLHPSNLRTLEDLAKYPFTVKDDLRRNYPFGMLATARENLIRIHASSGTTGKPTIVGYTRKDIDNWSVLMARSIRAAGGGPGQIVLVSYGYGLFTGGLGAHYGAERLGCAVIPMSGGQTEKQVQMITDLQPSIVMMTPSYMLTIADEFARQGLDAKKTSLRVGIFGAEPWSESLRAEIESRFHIDAVDIYGLSEVMGPGVASECAETKDGLVIWEDHFYPEIIDPDTGAVLPDGTYGELVLTSLTKEALPVIRYRTRDLACLLPPTARSMRRIGRIIGRSDDMLIIRGVNVFPSQIEELIVKDPRLSPHYLLVVSRVDRLDELEVRVETRTNLTAAEGHELANELHQQIKGWVGVTASVTPVPPGNIERVTVGKARRVIDNRPKVGDIGVQARGEKATSRNPTGTHVR